MRQTQCETSKSTHPVIFGIGTVECIVSSDKTELVRSWAEPTLQFSSRRQRRRAPQAGLVTETAEGNAELPQPRKEGRASACVCMFDSQECRMCGVRSGFWQAVCDQLSPFSLFLCRFTPLQTLLLWILPQCRQTEKTPCPLSLVQSKTSALIQS